MLYHLHEVPSAYHEWIVSQAASGNLTHLPSSSRQVMMGVDIFSRRASFQLRNVWFHVAPSTTVSERIRQIRVTYRTRRMLAHSVSNVQ